MKYVTVICLLLTGSLTANYPRSEESFSLYPTGIWEREILMESIEKIHFYLKVAKEEPKLAAQAIMEIQAELDFCKVLTGIWPPFANCD